MSATIGSKLPKSDANGLPAIAHAMLEDPHKAHLIIMLVDCGKIVEDVDEETRIPMARIRRIEAVLPADRQWGERLLRNALGARHGSQELPFEDERDLFSLFNPGVQWERNDAGDIVAAQDLEPESDTTGEISDIPGEQFPSTVTPDDPSVLVTKPEAEQVDDEFFDIEAAAQQLARKTEDDRIAAMQSKRAGRAPRVRAGKS